MSEEHRKKMIALLSDKERKELADYIDKIDFSKFNLLEWAKQFVLLPVKVKEDE